MPFSAFAQYPLLTLFAVAVVMMLLMSALSPRRQGGRPCRSCGAPNPEYAAFCRRCGRAIGK